MKNKKLCIGLGIIMACLGGTMVPAQQEYVDSDSTYLDVRVRESEMKDLLKDVFTSFVVTRFVDLSVNSPEVEEAIVSPEVKEAIMGCDFESLAGILKTLSKDANYEVRSSVSKAIGKVLTSGAFSIEERKLYSGAFVEVLKTLSEDGSYEVRTSVPETIGKVLTSEAFSVEERELHSGTLVGMFKPLIEKDDDDEYDDGTSYKYRHNFLKLDSVETIEKVLTSGAFSIEERKLYSGTLVEMLETLSEDARYEIRRSVASEAIKSVLTSGAFSIEERKLYSGTLVEMLETLSEDANRGVRGEVPETLGQVLASEAFSIEERKLYSGAFIEMLRAFSEDTSPNVQLGRQIAFKFYGDALNAFIDDYNWNENWNERFTTFALVFSGYVSLIYLTYCYYDYYYRATIEQNTNIKFDPSRIAAPAA